MTSVSIRPATPADIPAITRIYAHAVAHGTASFELEPPDEAEMARRMRALLDGGFPYLAAEIDGALLGYAYAGPYRTRPAYRFTVEDSIYIAPAAQRRGVGRALLDRLIAESEQPRLPADDRGDRRFRADRRRSSCTAPPASAWSARSRTSASSSAAGSTAC